MLTHNDQCGGVRRQGFWTWLVHENSALMNGISAFISKRLHPFHYMRLVKRQKSRKRASTKCQICPHIDLGLPSLPNWEKYISIVFKLPSLWSFLFVCLISRTDQDNGLFTMCQTLFWFHLLELILSILKTTIGERYSENYYCRHDIIEVQEGWIIFPGSYNQLVV